MTKTDPGTNICVPHTQIRGYYINGEYENHKDQFEPVYSSIEAAGTDICLGVYPLMQKQTALNVADSAAVAYADGLWPIMLPEQRVRLIMEFANELKPHREKIVDLLMFEICKSRADAEKEFDRTIQYIYDTCDEYLTMIYENRSKVDSGYTIRTSIDSTGVGLCMGPSNYPFNELFTSVIPMMISGNIVIVQHARRGILFNSIIEQIANEIFPAGTYQYLWGDPKEYIADVFMTKKISLFSFIGGTKTADAIMRYSPSLANLKVVLGLGAKNAAVIMEDANIDLSVRESVIGMLSYMGQRCTAHKITFVHHSVYEKYIEKLVKQLRSLKAGLPWDDDVFYTQLSCILDVNRMEDYVSDALMKGADKICLDVWKGNASPPKSYFAPVILTGVNETMKIYHEEQFGPVVPIVIFSDIQEVIDWHKKSEYGQQVAIFSDSFLTSKQKADELVKSFQKLVARVCKNHACMRGPDSVLFAGRKSSALSGLSLRKAIEEFAFLVVNSEKI